MKILRPWFQATLIMFFATTLATPAAATPKKPKYKCNAPELGGFKVSGEVRKVIDGTTFRLRVADKEYRMRLSGMHAPLLSQEYGPVSRRALMELIYMKTIEAHVRTLDCDDRWIAEVWVGDINVNRTMLAGGYAMFWQKYQDDPRLEQDERDAKSARLGMWSLADPPGKPWLLTR